ncbi:hypothetical protein [Desulfobacter postgatei]|jgi:hypothetical protein|uniref:hypothetical protein n=1 Tax=Desulfobacter TaxID=2289 RepID=UPI002A365C4B|nr:hypothetical protein [Desulfobacter postgatei]MDX9964788.1 hypothetical protein [Desulfobacter postgatei]
MDQEQIPLFFFSLLERQLDCMDYVGLTPRGKAKTAFIHEYLEEWLKDEEEAGLL